MNDNNPKTMYETVPMAAELNKVPGFDPLKFLRRTKDALKLDLPYQKLWFRIPGGQRAGENQSHDPATVPGQSEECGGIVPLYGRASGDVHAQTGRPYYQADL